MESSEAIKHAGVVTAQSRQDAWARCLCDYINPVMTKARRRPLFQKVVIANTGLIAIGVAMGIYLENRFFSGGGANLLITFIAGGVSLQVLINYLLVKLAFRPLEDVSETVKAIRGGQRGIRVPEVTDDPQIEELSRSLNSMLNSMERQRQRGAASAIKAQEEERKRIARDLHDETSQSLTGLVIGIRMVEESVPDSLLEIKERLQGIRELAHSTLNEVRAMSLRLRPSVLDDLGLFAALRSHVKEFSENTGISADLQMPAGFERLPPELETALYRVVQEALTNVARHSGANRCRVALQLKGAIVQGSISDNGRGFDPQAVMMSRNSGGLGLHGMKERMELVGGFLEFNSRPGEGSTIHLKVHVDFEEEVC